MKAFLVFKNIFTYSDELGQSVYPNLFQKPNDISIEEHELELVGQFDKLKLAIQFIKECLTKGDDTYVLYELTRKGYTFSYVYEND